MLLFLRYYCLYCWSVCCLFCMRYRVWFFQHFYSFQYFFTVSCILCHGMWLWCMFVNFKCCLICCICVASSSSAMGHLGPRKVKIFWLVEPTIISYATNRWVFVSPTNYIVHSFPLFPQNPVSLLFLITSWFWRFDDRNYIRSFNVCLFQFGLLVLFYRTVSILCDSLFGRLVYKCPRYLILHMSIVFVILGIFL